MMVGKLRIMPTLKRSVAIEPVRSASISNVSDTSVFPISGTNYFRVATGGNTAFFDLQFSTLVTMPLGTMLHSSSLAHLPADVLTDDNLVGLTQEVTGSFDPNSIEVSYQRLTLSQLVSGQALDYTIRFQNLGSDTAFTVLLVDTLDGQKLKLSTVRYMGSSHSCSCR